MFGSINALYSGLAFAGIIFTILLQKKELNYQREELRETRKEFETQNKTLKLQRFENTFFNLLSLHHQIIDSIDLDIEKEKRVKSPSVNTVRFSLDNPTEYERIIIKGRDIFKLTYDELKEKLGDKKAIESINIDYMEFYESVQTDFGHYFRNLYRIIKLVDQTEFHSHSELDVDPNGITRIERLGYTQPNYNTRYKYTSIIRAQLSDYELLWLFYNGLSEKGNEKFKPLIEKYSILKNLPKDKLNNPELTEEYKPKAYNNN
ncbi:putative phage abortive infection protein [Sinomicrobium kalidii]|uniref:putative phage abortive infection protein n=1 Tax=Sinomicrobium kalidii TaxID=2900738 RepID=UPI001E3BD8A3|nr:putative phage abortive infection protein [Sinomicrobium kalidii]UGU15966.1 putative phage abortive infection protein [Sinomicrobium kalidii]